MITTSRSVTSHNHKNNVPVSQAHVSVGRSLMFCTALSAILFAIGMTADALSIRNGFIAAGLLVIGLTIQALRPRRKTSVPRSGAVRPWASSVVRGTTAGLLLAIATAATVPLVRLLPTPAQWIDRDRPQLESRLETLCTAHDFESAAGFVEKRLAEKTSADWRGVLERRHIELLIAAGDVAQTEDRKAALWHRAAELATTYHIDDRLPQVLLDNLAGNHALADAQAKTANHLGQLLAAMAAIDLPAARDAVLRAIEKHAARPEWPDKLPQLLIENLLRWADASSSLVEKSSLLEQAAADCERLGVDPKLAELQLKSVQAQLANLAPAVVPAGTRARLVATYHVEPAIAFDVALESSTRQPLDNFAAKDFAITSGCEGIEFQLRRATYSTATDLSVVILLDYSPSTKPVRGAAETGVIALTSSAPAGTQFRVLAFHDSVVPVTDWTSRFSEIGTRLRNFQTSGSRTALAKAIEAGIAELAPRSGAKALVIFTDGSDTSGTAVNRADLIADCRRTGIRIMAVGLENADLDAKLLAELAAGTGGQYLAASRQEELIERFRTLRLDKTTPVYRIGLLATPDVMWPLQLTIGGGANPLHLELPQPSQRNQ